MKGATEYADKQDVYVRISIHTPYEGSDSMASVIALVGDISIHTPYEGSDIDMTKVGGDAWNFNPHSL